MTVQALHAGAKVEGARSPASSPGSVRDSVPHLHLISKSPNSHPSPHNSHYGAGNCPNPQAGRGVCGPHGNVKHQYFPCRKRTCEVCGPDGRLAIAKRIAWGVRFFGINNCTYLVLTFDTTLAEQSWWKKVAVRRVGALVEWLRKKRGMPALQYVATYELTKRGRIHVNLLVSHWKFVPKALLDHRWGAYVWIKPVHDPGIGMEMAKAYGPEGLAAYLMKLDQAVGSEWGRRVSFSRNWPKLPDDVVEASEHEALSLKPSDAVGIVNWDILTEAELWGERRDRGSEELAPGHWKVGSWNPDCRCFMTSYQRGEKGGRDDDNRR